MLALLLTIALPTLQRKEIDLRIELSGIGMGSLSVRAAKRNAVSHSTYLLLRMLKHSGFVLLVEVEAEIPTQQSGLSAQEKP